MGIPIHVPIRHPRSWATSTPAASTLRTQHVPKSPDERPRPHPCSTGQDKMRGHERPSTCGSVAWGQRSHPSRSMYDDSLCCLGRSGDDSPSTIMSSGHLAPSLKVRFPQSRKGARDGRYGSPLASYRPSSLSGVQSNTGFAAHMYDSLDRHHSRLRLSLWRDLSRQCSALALLLLLL